MTDRTLVDDRPQPSALPKVGFRHELAGISRMRNDPVPFLPEVVRERGDIATIRILGFRMTPQHDAVLPRVAATVHHGGAGTLAASLRAGRPTMIGSFYERFRDLTPDRLAAALRRLLAPEVRAAAAAFGERLRSEPDAATRVAALVETQLAPTPTPS